MLYARHPGGRPPPDGVEHDGLSIRRFGPLGLAPPIVKEPILRKTLFVGVHRNRETDDLKQFAVDAILMPVPLVRPGRMCRIISYNLRSHVTC